MRVFVINLDRNTDRMAFVSRQLAERGVAFERLSAVDGRALDPAERKRCYSHVRTLLDRGYGIRAGELGCTLSHVNIYRRMVAEGLDMACVLEDDVMLAPEFATVLSEIERTIDPVQKRVIQLSSGLKDPDDTGTPEFRRLSSAMFADAYVITRPAAAAILKVNFPVFRVVDAWGRLRSRAGFGLYRYHPTVAWQDFDRFATDVRPVLPSWRGSLVWKLWRVFGRTADWFLWKVTGR